MPIRFQRGVRGPNPHMKYLKNFTFETGMLWIFVSVIFIVLSSYPEVRAFGIVASSIVLFCSAFLIISVYTSDQILIIPFLFIIILVVMYIYINFLIILELEVIHSIDEDDFWYLVMENVTDVDLLKEYVITIIVMGIVTVVFLCQYLFRGLVAYYLLLSLRNEEERLEGSIFAQLSTRLA